MLRLSSMGLLQSKKQIFRLLKCQSRGSKDCYRSYDRHGIPVVAWVHSMIPMGFPTYSYSYHILDTIADSIFTSDMVS